MLSPATHSGTPAGSALAEEDTVMSTFRLFPALGAVLATVLIFASVLAGLTAPAALAV